MQQTISGKVFLNLLGTLGVSYLIVLINTAKVKILLNENNPQVTNASNSLVGTSEAIRLLNSNPKFIHTLNNSNQKLIHTLSNSSKDLKFKQ
jgi:hypothetical protein